MTIKIPCTSFRPDSFPDDEIERTITSVGPLFRKNRVNAEPYWWITLEQIGSGSAKKREVVKIPSVNILHMRIGSVWLGSRMIDSTGYWSQFSHLQIDCDHQKIFVRELAGVSGGSALTFVSADTKDISGPRYVMLPITSLGLDCDVALIRCSELFRAVFGSLLPVARYAFDFGDEGQNDFLYRFDLTGVGQDHIYNFFRTRSVTQEFEERVAAMIFIPETRQALCQLSRTARAQFHAKLDVWPSMYAPMQGVRDWQVFGKSMTGSFYEGGLKNEPATKRFFGISQLVGFDFPLELPQFKIKFGGAAKRKGGIASGRKQTPVSRTSNLPRLLATSTPPGNNATSVETFKEGPELFKGLKYGKVTREPSSYESAGGVKASYFQDEKLVQKFSALEGGTGDETVGHYSVSYEEAEHQVVAPKPFKSLFNLESVDRVNITETQSQKVPPKIRRVIRAVGASMFLPNLQNVTFMMAGMSSLQSPFDHAALLSFPDSWGGKARTSAGDGGMRKALWVDVTHELGRIAILDVEGRFEKESVGAQIYIFPGKLSSQVTLDLISKILHAKVCGTGWLNADHYYEPFHSLALNHINQDRADRDDRTIARVQRKLGEAVGLLQAA